MSELFKVFTPEQLYTAMRDKIIADNVGLTNFNVGSRIRSLLEAVALIVGSQGFDYLDALRKGIRVALYDGFDFKRKAAVKSSGYFRFYRMPSFVMKYTGGGTSCLVTFDGTFFSTNVAGLPGDNLMLDVSTYATISSLVAAIEAHANYEASMVGADNPTTDLYHYSSRQAVGAMNYLNVSGLDILTGPASAIPILTGKYLSLSDVSLITTVDGQIDAGSASSGAIPSQCTVEGVIGNIIASAVDTRNGKGALQTPISGVDYVINDSAFVNGEDEESDIDRLKRFKYYVRGLTGSTESGIIAAVMAIAGIRSVTVMDNYPQRGQLTVVADDGTGHLSTDKINEIILTLTGDPTNYEAYPGYRAAGITVNVQAPVIHDTDVTATIYRIGTSSDEDQIKQYAKTAIENYINTRRLGEDVVFTELVKVAKGSHAEIYDIVFSTPTANIPIAATEVARTGSGTGGSVTLTVITLTVAP